MKIKVWGYFFIFSSILHKDILVHKINAVNPSKTWCFLYFKAAIWPVLPIFYLGAIKYTDREKEVFCHKKSSLLRQSSWAVEQAEILPWFTVSPSHVRWLIWSYSRNLDFSRTENATLAIQRYLCWNVLGKLGVQMSWLGIRINIK